MFTTDHFHLILPEFEEPFISIGIPEKVILLNFGCNFFFYQQFLYGKSILY